MTRIFISYNRKSTQFAEALRDRLKSWNYKTWMDIDDISPSSEWEDEIDRGLKTCDIVLGIVTTAAVESDNVQYEWLWALIRSKPLILVKLEDCKMHPKFERRQILDFTKNEKIAWKSLHDGLRSLEAENEPEVFKDASKPLPSVRAYLKDKISGFEQFEKNSFVPMTYTVSDTKLKDNSALFGNPIEIYKNHNQFVLLGLPGVGKSMVLRTLFRKIATLHLKSSSEPMPLWIDLNDPENPEDALDLFEHWYSTRYELEKSFKYMANTKCPIIFLDGLNEMPLGTRSKRAESISRWAMSKPNARIIVGCRARDYEDDRDLYLGANIEKIFVQPFEMPQIRQFLRKNIEHPEASTKLIHHIEKDDAIYRLAQIPLHLSMLAQLSIWQMSIARPPDRLKTLYGEFLKKRYSHEKAKISNLLDWNEIEQKMGKLAYSLIAPRSKTKEGAISASEDKVKRIIGKKALQNAYDLRLLVRVKDSNRSKIFRSTNTRVQFSHQSLHGYFALPKLNAALANSNKQRIFSFGFNSMNPAAIIRQIGDLGDTAELAVDSLIPLLSHPSVEIRIATENALTDIGIPSIPPLIKLLSSKDTKLCATVARILKSIGEPVLGPLLLSLLKNSDIECMTEVGDILSSMPGMPPQLSQALMYSKNKKDFKGYVAEGLARIRSSRAVQPLIAMLKDDDFWVRADIAWALGQIGDKIALPPLIELVKTEVQPNVCLHADDAIRRFGIDGIHFLITSMTEPDLVKRDNLERALKARLTSDEPKRDQTVVRQIIKIVNANDMKNPFLEKVAKYYARQHPMDA
jgi:hypothetical protein